MVFVQSVNRFNHQLGKGLKWGTLALVGILLYEAFTRYVLNSPSVYAMEVATYIFLAYCFLGGGYALLTEAHVRMDAFYSGWSLRKRAIINAVTFPIMTFWLVVLIWKGSIYAIAAIVAGEVTVSSARLPTGPIKVVMVVGATILLVQALAFLIQDLFIARGKRLQ